MTTEKAVHILYTNYKGDTRIRHILPIGIHFSSSEWHSEPQWLLDAFDIDKNANRSFALRDIRAWFQERP